MRRIFSFLILANLFFSTFDTYSQKRRGSAGGIVPVKSEKKQPCNGGWSGIVTYSKTLRDSIDSDEPGIRKDIDRIIHKDSRTYDYIGRAIVDGTDPQRPVVTAQVNFTDNDLNFGVEKVFDSCNSRESGHWFAIEGRDDRQTQAQVSGPARSFNLSVNEFAGDYSFSLQLPDAVGDYKREQHVKRTGHCQPQNNQPFDKSDKETTKVDGESFSIDGQRINPDAPDHLSGTKVWGDDGSGPVRTFIYQVTWRFTRCPQKLLITELKFEHPQFPNFEDWKEIDDIKGTIDGNKVKVRAKVLNMSAETKYADLTISETYKGDKYNGARPDELLPEGEASLRLEAGEEREVELIWDVEGQSWFDDGRPHLFHRIKAELAENGQKKDEKEKPLNIAPKPLILVHGIWESYKVWNPLYQNLLTADHSYNWKAYSVGENAHYGAMSTGGKFLSDWYSDSVYDNADQLARYIRYAQETSNAWHVDMVAHSTGGLVARLYMHKLMPNVPDARPQVKHLVMLGTPNGGVPCVDVFLGKLGIFKHELKAARELTNDEMLNFNHYVVNTGGTKFSALAGNPVPIVCGGLEWNDGFVTVKSAHYGVADTGQANDLHPQLTDAKNFGNFVLPHLVTGPSRTYPLPVKNDPTDWKRWQLNNRDYDVNNGSGQLNLRPAYSPEDSYAVLLNGIERPHGPNTGITYDPLPQPNSTFSKQLTLQPKQVTEIDIPVEAAINFGVTFVADPGVSVQLFNDRGQLVSRSNGGAPLSSAVFRQVLTQHPVANGIWKLKIENTTDFEQLFGGFSWSMDSFPPK